MRDRHSPPDIHSEDYGLQVWDSNAAGACWERPAPKRYVRGARLSFWVNHGCDRPAGAVKHLHGLGNHFSGMTIRSGNRRGSQGQVSISHDPQCIWPANSLAVSFSRYKRALETFKLILIAIPTYSGCVQWYTANVQKPNHKQLDTELR
jgi:hypothetical protein